MLPSTSLCFRCCAASLTSREYDKFMPPPPPDENYLHGVHYDESEDRTAQSSRSGDAKQAPMAALFADDSDDGAAGAAEIEMTPPPKRRESVVAREKKVQFASNFFDLTHDPKEQHAIEVVS